MVLRGTGSVSWEARSPSPACGMDARVHVPDAVAHVPVAAARHGRSQARGRAWLGRAHFDCRVAGTRRSWPAVAPAAALGAGLDVRQAQLRRCSSAWRSCRICCRSAHTTSRWRMPGRRRTRSGGRWSRVLAREAELKTLRAQIDPHFLFNSLHSINGLIGADPAAARRMTVLLGEFLRTSVAVGQRPLITLGEELQLVDRYLAIEQIRFGKRLTVATEIDPALRDCLVPPAAAPAGGERDHPRHRASARRWIDSRASHAQRLARVRHRDEHLRPGPAEAAGHRCGARKRRRRLANQFPDERRPRYGSLPTSIGWSCGFPYERRTSSARTQGREP